MSDDACTDSYRIGWLSKLMLIVLLILWPLGSALMMPNSSEVLAEDLTNPIVQIYLPTMVLQLIMLGLIVATVRHDGGDLLSIGLGKFTLDKLFIGLAFFVFSGLILSLTAMVVEYFDLGNFRDPTALLPTTTAGRIVWGVLTVIVAFTEEMTFRGFALTRLERVFRNRVLTVLVVSIAFSAGHLYQGLGGVIVIFVYGLMFAVLFIKTGSIWPGIIAHFLQDFTPMFTVELLKRFHEG